MTSGQVIDAYLDQIAAALPGPRRARQDILAELRSGLLDAVGTHRLAGVPAATAAEAAITEFGDPRRVAAAFRPELTATQARRVALILVATGPPIGLMWAHAARASHIGIRHALPWQWAGAPPLSPAAFPLAAAALLIAVWAALATVAATGRLARWLPAGPRTAAATAATAGFGAATADLAIIALLGSQMVAAPGTLSPAPVTAVAITSLTRLALARRAARRCLTARAALA